MSLDDFLISKYLPYKQNFKRYRHNKNHFPPCTIFNYHFQFDAVKRHQNSRIWKKRWDSNRISLSGQVLYAIYLICSKIQFLEIELASFLDKKSRPFLECVLFFCQQMTLPDVLKIPQIGVKGFLV